MLNCSLLSVTSPWALSFQLLIWMPLEVVVIAQRSTEMEGNKDSSKKHFCTYDGMCRRIYTNIKSPDVFLKKKMIRTVCSALTEVFKNSCQLFSEHREESKENT